MFNLGKWFKKKSEQSPNLEISSKPAVEILVNKPATATKPAAKTDASGLKPEEIRALRQLKFKELGIPYELVSAAEGRGIRGIDPQNIIKDTRALNEKLALYGFAFQIDYRECFDGQVMYLEYENLRQHTRKTKNQILPEHSLLDMIILRQTEKTIRKKYQLIENPVTGKAAEKFQAEVKADFEASWQQSKEYQLWHQAEQRLKRERDPKNQKPLLEVDIKAMIEAIKAERLAIGRKV